MKSIISNFRTSPNENGGLRVRESLSPLAFSNETSRDVVKNEEEALYHVEVDGEAIKERAREEMWYKLLGKFVF